MTKKRYQGLINNKERTMQKFLDAVGEIMRTEGYTGLGVNKIARTAGANKALIYSYFGNVNNLIARYARENDYWLQFNKDIESPVEEKNLSYEMVESILMNQFDYFNTNSEMQKIVLWQLSEKNHIMAEIINAREKVGNGYFKLADQIFSNKIDFRAISAVLVAAIYHLVLFSKTSTSTFCEIDLKRPEGIQRIKKAISTILKLANLAKWHEKVRQTGFKAFNTIARSIQNHYQTILNYFDTDLLMLPRNLLMRK